MKENGYVSNQIAVYKTDKCLIETVNCLRAAPDDLPWHIHAEGKTEGYSLIRMVALDYSRGTGENSVSVYANLKPEEVKFLYMRLCMGFENVCFEQQKIFSDREKGGVVTFVQILRSGYDDKGNPKRYPWMISIGNGTGRVAYNRNGGQYCEKNSYREEKRVRVFLDDMDLFRILSRTCTVIEAFEQKSLQRGWDSYYFRNLHQEIQKDLAYYFEKSQADYPMAA